MLFSFGEGANLAVVNILALSAITFIFTYLPGPVSTFLKAL